MSRRLPLLIVVVAFLWSLTGLLPTSVPQPEGVTRFGRLPVLSEGRVKPLDSTALRIAPGSTCCLKATSISVPPWKSVP